jgi:cytochrome b561
MLTNTQQTWGSLTKFLHWLIVAMVLVQVPAGYLMSYTYGLAVHDAAVQPLQTLMSQIHHTLGLLILVLAPARLAWRLAGPVPGTRHILARLTHALFYMLLLVLPLSGWAAVSVVAGAPIWLFGAQMPPILPPLNPESPFGYTLYAHVHIYAAWLGGVLLLLHVGAAFWHHAVHKDDVFRRMWPLAKT